MLKLMIETFCFLHLLAYSFCLSLGDMFSIFIYLFIYLSIYLFIYLFIYFVLFNTFNVILLKLRGKEEIDFENTYFRLVLALACGLSFVVVVIVVVCFMSSFLIFSRRRP